MPEETVRLTPTMAASPASWWCVQSHDREGWLALMADDVVSEESFPSSSPFESMQFGKRDGPEPRTP
jgi:steroid delta-isomerase